MRDRLDEKSVRHASLGTDFLEHGEGLTRCVNNDVLPWDRDESPVRTTASVWLGSVQYVGRSGSHEHERTETGIWDIATTRSPGAL